MVRNYWESFQPITKLQGEILSLRRLHGEILHVARLQGEIYGVSKIAGVNLDDTGVLHAWRIVPQRIPKDRRMWRTA